MNGSESRSVDNVVTFPWKFKTPKGSKEVRTVNNDVSGEVNLSLNWSNWLNVVDLFWDRGQSTSKSQSPKAEIKKTISKESTRNSKLEVNQYLSDSLTEIWKIWVDSPQADQKISEVERKKFYNSQIDLLEWDIVKELWRILDDSWLETDIAIDRLTVHIQDKVVLLRSYVEKHKIEIWVSPSGKETVKG